MQCRLGRLAIYFDGLRGPSDTVAKTPKNFRQPTPRNHDSTFKVTGQAPQPFDGLSFPSQRILTRLECFFLSKSSAPQLIS